MPNDTAVISKPPKETTCRNTPAKKTPPNTNAVKRLDIEIESIVKDKNKKENNQNNIE